MLWIEINYFEIKLIFSVLLFLILDTGAFKISNPQTFLAYDKEAVIQGMCGQLLFFFPLHCQTCYGSYWALLFNLNKSFATHLFQKKKFFIEPRGNPELPKMTFYTNHYKK